MDFYNKKNDLTQRGNAVSPRFLITWCQLADKNREGYPPAFFSKKKSKELKQ